MNPREAAHKAQTIFNETLKQLDKIPTTASLADQTIQKVYKEIEDAIETLEETHGKPEKKSWL